MKPAIKTILFCSYMLLIPLLGKADIVGGHDRQRLNLLFLDYLRYYFAAQPLEINKSIFPVQVLDTDIQPILDVLSEEGGLIKTTDIKNVSADSLNMTRVTKYHVNPDASDQTFILGYVKPDSLLVVSKLPEEKNDVIRYQISFSWHLVQSAEWIWAPVLDKNTRIIRLRKATTQLLTSEATIVWKNNHWQVDSVHVF